jgi:hypothetical protein
MINRRSILGFLGLAPAAAMVARLPVADTLAVTFPLEGPVGTIGPKGPPGPMSLSAIHADVGTITAGKMRSRSGNIAIDFDAKTITIR